MLIDLSYPIHTGMGVYPNDPPVIISDASGPKSGRCHISRVDFGTHTGTHIDMPFHFIPEGQTADVFPLGNCMGQGFLIEKEYHEGPLLTLSADELTGMPEGAVFVLYTHWQERYGGEDFFTEYPALTIEAAELLLEKGVRAIAMDTPSIDNRYTNGELHKLVLGRGVAIIETLANLDRLAAAQQDEAAVIGKTAADGKWTAGDNTATIGKTADDGKWTAGDNMATIGKTAADGKWAAGGNTATIGKTADDGKWTAGGNIVTNSNAADNEESGAGGKLAVCGKTRGFFLCAAPLKLAGGDGSPVRAFALTE